MQSIDSVIRKLKYGVCIGGCGKFFSVDDKVKEICAPWKKSVLNLRFCTACEPSQELKKYYNFEEVILTEEDENDISLLQKISIIIKKYPNLIKTSSEVLLFIKKEKPILILNEMKDMGLISEECIMDAMN